jgi:hypothetical protein
MAWYDGLLTPDDMLRFGLGQGPANRAAGHRRSPDRWIRAPQPRLLRSPGRWRRFLRWASRGSNLRQRVMAGPFDWVRALTGDTDNPEEDLGQWSDAQQAQNRAAIGYDPNAQPPAAVGPGGQAATAAGAGGALSGAQGAATAQAASTLPPNQEPNATKTPISLGHLMMNLQQYNERE